MLLCSPPCCFSWPLSMQCGSISTTPSPPGMMLSTSPTACVLMTLLRIGDYSASADSSSALLVNLAFLLVTLNWGVFDAAPADRGPVVRSQHLRRPPNCTGRWFLGDRARLSDRRPGGDWSISFQFNELRTQTVLCGTPRSRDPVYRTHECRVPPWNLLLLRRLLANRLSRR